MTNTHNEAGALATEIAEFLSHNDKADCLEEGRGSAIATISLLMVAGGLAANGRLDMLDKDSFATVMLPFMRSWRDQIDANVEKFGDLAMPVTRRDAEAAARRERVSTMGFVPRGVGTKH